MYSKPGTFLSASKMAGTTEDAALQTFRSQLVTQANAYMNATWAIAVAKAGDE